MRTFALLFVSRGERSHCTLGETLEKLARAMEVPLYVFFYNGEEPSSNLPRPAKLGTYGQSAWSNSAKGAIMLHQFRQAFSHASDRDLKILFSMAQKNGSTSSPKAPYNLSPRRG